MPAVGLPPAHNLPKKTAFRKQFHAGGLSDRRLPGAGDWIPAPMSGFDRQHVDDALFLTGSTLKSNLLINIGYGDSSKLYARLPRLSFEEACGLL